MKLLCDFKKEDKHWKNTNIIYYFVCAGLLGTSNMNKWNEIEKPEVPTVESFWIAGAPCPAGIVTTCTSGC